MADGTAPTCGRVGSRHSFSTAFQCQLKGCFAISGGLLQWFFTSGAIDRGRLLLLVWVPFFVGVFFPKSREKIWWGRAGFVSLRSAFEKGAVEFFKCLIIRVQIGFTGFLEPEKRVNKIWLIT
jgi:hypothetical protein